MIFAVLLSVTLLEIYVLIGVGGAIGGFSTILLVIITAFVGSLLLKQQSWSILAKAQQATDNGQPPTFAIIEGVVILISAVLLIAPGFITDSLGLLGLMPWSRHYFINHIAQKNASRIFSKNRIFIRKMSADKTQKPNQKNTIEGEFWED